MEALDAVPVAVLRTGAHGTRCGDGSQILSFQQTCMLADAPSTPKASPSAPPTNHPHHTRHPYHPHAHPLTSEPSAPTQQLDARRSRVCGPAKRHGGCTHVVNPIFNCWCSSWLNLPTLLPEIQRIEASAMGHRPPSIHTCRRHSACVRMICPVDR